MAEILDPRHIDKRTWERYVRSGQLDEKAYERYIKDLPDVADKAAPVETRMSDIDEDEETPEFDEEEAGEEEAGEEEEAAAETPEAGGTTE